MLKERSVTSLNGLSLSLQGTSNMIKYYQSGSLILRGNRTVQVTNNCATGYNLFGKEYTILGKRPFCLSFLVRQQC